MKEYKDKNLWLMKGDCLKKMNRIKDQSVDLILTDLPYGTTYAKFETVLKNNGKQTKSSIIDLSIMWELIDEKIKKFGNIILFSAQPFTTTLITSNPEMYRYSFIWEKNKAANHVAVKYQPLKVHEEILVFTESGVNTGSKNPIKYNPQGVNWKSEIKERKKDIKKEGTFTYNSLKKGKYKVAGTNYPKSILRFNIPSKPRYHPTQKPVDLLEYIIKTYSDEGDIVLDFTMGSGSTGIACLNTNRKFIGIEKDEIYFDIAKERILEARK